MTSGSSGVYPTILYGFIRGSQGSISPEKNPDFDRLYSSWRLDTGLPSFTIIGVKLTPDPGDTFLKTLKINGVLRNISTRDVSTYSGGMRTWQWNSQGFITATGNYTLEITY